MIHPKYLGKTDFCPYCEKDLQYTVADQPDVIYSHAVSVEIPGVYDGGLFYLCPFCSGAWHRWPKLHYLHARAEPYVESYNNRRIPIQET